MELSHSPFVDVSSSQVLDNVNNKGKGEICNELILSLYSVLEVFSYHAL